MVTREFGLQPALSYKERLEEMCQMALAEIEASFAREYQVLEMLYELERVGYQKLEQHHCLGRLDMATIGAYFGDLHSLQERIERQLAVVKDLADKAERKREELIEITKEKKVLKKLKEKHEKRVLQAMVRAENKLMDDIAVSQFLRRRADG